MWSEIKAKIRGMLGRDDFARGLDEEMRFHLETRMAELVRAGIDRREAEWQARREFGPARRSKEESREAWRFGWLSDFAVDLRYATRGFMRTPAFTAAAILAMALGIGANSAVYSAIEAIFWKPLPVADPNSLVSFSTTVADGDPETDLPSPLIRQLRESGVFSGVIAEEADGLSFSYDGRAERIIGEFVSPEYFSVLGVKPFIGQPFSSEVQSGHWAAEAVLSYDYWKARFGGDPAVIGRTIRLNTYPFTIVGVSPPSFTGLSRGTDYELRIPFLPDGGKLAQIAEISGDPDRWHIATARLASGIGLIEAQTRADALLQEFLKTTPFQDFRDAGLKHLHLVPAALGDFERVDQFRTPLFVLMLLAAVVLVISCANVANMLLARAASREREIAVRVSIGAGRARLVRQMLAESVLLAIGGAAVGTAIAEYGAGALVRVLPQGHIAIVMDLKPDWRVLLATIAISLLVGIIFGLVPALQATRGDLAASLKSDSAGAIGGGRGGLRKGLVIAQVALSLVLLVVAGTFVKTLNRLQPSEYRGDPNRVLLFTLKPQQEIYSDQQKLQLVAEIQRRILAIPGVESAALAEFGPLGSRILHGNIGTPGHDGVRSGIDSVTPGFFDATGMRIISGRDFSLADSKQSAPVAIVNASLARRLFGNGSAIGRTLIRPGARDTRQYTIVGVVADVHYFNLHGVPDPGVWFAILQDSPYMPTLHVRISAGDSAGMIAAVQREFDAIDKGFPVFNIKTFEMRIEDSLARERMLASLSGAFGVTAIALAAVGLYGLLAYAVSRRTREIGIRMALGSRRTGVVWLVMREALLLTAIGAAVGAVTAVGAFSVMRSLVDGVSSIGVEMICAGAALLAFVALLAAAIPAARASRINPLVALRQS